MTAYPRPLAGMLPYEDRTFLSTHSRTSASSSCPIAQADFSISRAPLPLLGAPSARERVIHDDVGDYLDRRSVQQRGPVAPLPDRL
jgi:hypothetical protein